MDTRIVKIYYEYLAKLILETFLPDDYHDLILSDAPDLRANETTGIEVTRAMLDGEGQASGIFEHIRDKKINDIDVSLIGQNLICNICTYERMHNMYA